MDDAGGWTAIEGLLDATEVAALNAACELLLRLPAEERWAGDKPAAGTRHLVGLDERVPLVDRILSRPPLMQAVVSLLGPRHHRDQVAYRCPRPTHGGQRLHADDAPKLDDGPARVATAIIALTDFDPVNGATRVVPGSHRRPDQQRLSGSAETHPAAVVLTGSAGTAFVFSGHLLHSGTPNRSGRDRPALQVVWRAGAAPNL